MQKKFIIPLAGLVLIAGALSVSGANGLTTVNMASATTTPSILDAAAPKAYLFLTVKKATPGQNVPVIAWADDNVGIAKVEIYVDGALKVSSSSTLQLFNLDTIGFATGNHRLQVKAYDAAGNVGSSSISKLKIKNTPPGQIIRDEKGNHDHDKVNKSGNVQNEDTEENDD